MRSGLASRAFLAGGFVATLAYFLISSDLAEAIIFTVLQAAALVALIVGVRHHQPEAKGAWLTLGAGLVLYVAGNLVWYVYQVAANVTLPYPSVSDALLVPAYMLLLVGIGGVIWSRFARADAGSIIDAGIIGIAVGVLAWEFLVQNYLSDPNLSGLGRGVSIAYPTIDALTVALLALLIFVPGSRGPAFWLLGVGLVGQLVADIGYSFSVLAGSFEFGTTYFVGWMLFYVCFGAAMLHPSMSSLSEPRSSRRPELPRLRMAFLGLAATLPLIIIGFHLADLERGLTPGEGLGLLFAAGAMFLLVLFRMRGLLVDLDESRRIERLKDEFVSVVSHELRTPLTSIRGALGLVAGGATGPLPDKAKHMVEIASQNADRLVRLVNDILDVERMESGKVQMEMRSCSVSELFRRSVEEMQPMADEAGARLRVEPADAHVIADPDRIVQAITNLLNNAIKFSSPGSEVVLAAVSDAGEVRVQISDTGRGIPARHLSKIFDRFQQVDPSDSRDKGGTGLGLAISKSIVDHHGGRIWADTQEDVGSTFYFTLPAVGSMTQVPAREDEARVNELVKKGIAGRGDDVVLL